MKITKTGNIKIHINPERKYQGQFVGWKYYKLAAIKTAFPFIDNIQDLEPDDFDLGAGANNADMIMHHIEPYKRVGYVVE